MLKRGGIFNANTFASEKNKENKELSTSKDTWSSKTPVIATDSKQCLEVAAILKQLEEQQNKILNTVQKNQEMLMEILDPDYSSNEDPMDWEPESVPISHRLSGSS